MTWSWYLRISSPKLQKTILKASEMDILQLDQIKLTYLYSKIPLGLHEKQYFNSAFEEIIQLLLGIVHGFFLAQILFRHKNQITSPESRTWAWVSVFSLWRSESNVSKMSFVGLLSDPLASIKVRQIIRASIAFKNLWFEIKHKI